MQYAELNVRLEPRQGGGYEVLAWGESGEAVGTFVLPFSDLELENFVLRVGRTRRGTRRLESPEMQRARDFGGRLFNALLSAQVRDLYRDCYASARGDGKGLRVKLSLGQAPELTDVPWEYLYDSPSFLSISQFTPVVRYLDLPRARPPLEITFPLRVLAMISAPTGEVALDVEDERRKVELALRGRLIEQELVEITWLEKATLRELQHELRHGPYHVFHFIGHGAYDPGLGESILLFEDEDGRGSLVSGTQLGTILSDHTSLRLAVLNACEGARTSRDDPFSGVAASLVQHGLPAVIAMQFEITDRAAIIFAEEFYAALVDGLPVDAALAETRKAIYGDGNDIEWGTPVLFMRVRDGRVFEVPKPASDLSRGQERERLRAREQAELEEAERVASERAEAERLDREQTEREEAERAAGERAKAERQARERAAPGARRVRDPGFLGRVGTSRWLIGAAAGLAAIGILVWFLSRSPSTNPSPPAPSIKRSRPMAGAARSPSATRVRSRHTSRWSGDTAGAPGIANLPSRPRRTGSSKRSHRAARLSWSPAQLGLVCTTPQQPFGLASGRGRGNDGVRAIPEPFALRYQPCEWRPGSGGSQPGPTGLLPSGAVSRPGLRASTVQVRLSGRRRTAFAGSFVIATTSRAR
jgi:CHAT domain